MQRRPAVRGPVPATPQDIDAINIVFSDAFTDRYHRDGMTGVRVPFLSPEVWRYALAGAGEGAMVWRDEGGHIVAFNLVHRSGAEGWMGPLAVRADHQGSGLGQSVVRAGVDWLREGGARVIGLETMPRTVDNIGFYSRLGFRPRHLTVTLAGSMPRESPADPGTSLLSAAGAARAAWISECGALLQQLLPGADFARELALTLDHGLGDAALVRSGDQLLGFVLWHAAPLALGRGIEDVRVLKLAATDDRTLARLFAAAESAAARVGGVRLLVRCQTAYPEAYARLIASGYRVHWTDLRMTLEGYEERPVTSTGGTVFSNWEI